ncbi:cytochrome P450 [Kribbella capetownensis]|uniref:Cytochrome P450 n=1 Tax=Kribbella capetownensis TaxID=1572659 RepID=A0A4R0IYG9_9ACTN|nr:cytochrome P450 [Kribbella capetownensis]TCC33885.1 cytochrome P450 [Kribbella capetownensis]
MSDAAMPAVGCPEFDPFQAHRNDPYPLFAQMRERFPVAPNQTLGGVQLVTRYDDIERIASDPETYSSVGSLPVPVASNVPEVIAALPEFATDPDVASGVEVDGTRHERMRTTIQRAYRGPRVSALAADVEQHANALLDRIAGDGQADLLAAYAHPLVSRATSMLLGVPEDYHDRYEIWAHSMAAILTPTVPVEQKLQAARQLHDYQAFALEWRDQRRTSPTDDVFSTFAAGEGGEAEPLQDNELLYAMLLHWVAGYDTTRNGILSTLHLMLRHPGLWERATDPREAEHIAEEALRFEAPHRGLMRVTTKPVTISGTDLPAGTPLLLMFASANRDEHVFPNADQFVVDRPNAKQHVAFGKGPHLCPGATMARYEIRTAARVAATRLPKATLVGDPEWRPDYFFRGLTELRVTW